VKLTNMTITPKLGILVGVALFGLCVAGVLAGLLMQREMLNARIDQVHAIVEVGRNMAVGLQKQVDDGKLTKEAALAEFGRLANAMTYDNGAGYLFGTTFDGVTVLSPGLTDVLTTKSLPLLLRMPIPTGAPWTLIRTRTHSGPFRSRLCSGNCSA